MVDANDTNDDIWKSDKQVAYWVETAEDREQRRAEQRRLVAALLPYSDEEEFVFLDLGAGTGAAARAVLDRYSGASAILADYSSKMMEEGARSLKSYEGRYTYVEFDLTSRDWPDAIPRGLGAVISSLSVHHLPDERKEELFAEVLTRLQPGGWYLNYDPVTAGDPVIEAAWQRANDRLDPTTAAKRAKRTEDEQHRYENHVRHMIPLAPQLDFMRRAGFEAIDLYWKHLDYVIYGGRRPVPATS